MTASAPLPKCPHCQVQFQVADFVTDNVAECRTCGRSTAFYDSKDDIGVNRDTSKSPKPVRDIREF